MRFNVGDRVRVNTPNYPYFHGRVGTITALRATAYSVRLDGNTFDTKGGNDENLEPIELPPIEIDTRLNFKSMEFL